MRSKEAAEELQFPLRGRHARRQFDQIGAQKRVLRKQRSEEISPAQIHSLVFGEKVVFESPTRQKSSSSEPTVRRGRTSCCRKVHHTTSSSLALFF